MTTRPAITTITTIRDAAKIMTARHYRHLPVAGDAGLIAVADITNVCWALINTEKDDRRPVADPGPGGTATPVRSPSPPCLSPAAGPSMPADADSARQTMPNLRPSDE